MAIPATSPRELLGSSEQQQKQMEHHPASGFGTKDSSDSKSHDSGIDSIEKPGMSFGVLWLLVHEFWGFKDCGVNIGPGLLMIAKNLKN